MKIYIAAPWEHRKQMPEIAARLEAGGNTITHKWWETEDTPENVRGEAELRHQAGYDVAGVKNAKIMLLINSAKSEGKSLEQGIAVAHGIPIIAVGKRGEFSKNVFHYLPQYKWVATLEDAGEVISTIKWLVQE